MERDPDADKLALLVAFVIAPLSFAVVGAFMWPMFRSAGDAIHQLYTIPEILTGFVGGGLIGEVVCGFLMYVRSKTETPAENGHQ